MGEIVTKANVTEWYWKWLDRVDNTRFVQHKRERRNSYCLNKILIHLNRSIGAQVPSCPHPESCVRWRYDVENGFPLTSINTSLDFDRPDAGRGGRSRVPPPPNSGTGRAVINRYNYTGAYKRRLITGAS